MSLVQRKELSLTRFMTPASAFDEILATVLATVSTGSTEVFTELGYGTSHRGSLQSHRSSPGSFSVHVISI
jgi:hypothetical protein